MCKASSEQFDKLAEREWGNAVKRVEQQGKQVDGSEVLVVPAGLHLRGIDVCTDADPKAGHWWRMYTNGHNWGLRRGMGAIQYFDSPQAALDWLAEEYGK